MTQLPRLNYCKELNYAFENIFAPLFPILLDSFSNYIYLDGGRLSFRSDPSIDFAIQAK